MTSTIDPSKIGKPVQRARRHVRSLTGYKPETDEKGQEKWPKGDEKVWKDGLRGVDRGMSMISLAISTLTDYMRSPYPPQMFPPSLNLWYTTSRPPLLARRTTWTTPELTRLPLSLSGTTSLYVSTPPFRFRSSLTHVQVNWNETQLHHTRKGNKRAYYLSLEFLMGRAFDNALLNLGLKKQYDDGVNKLGFNLEDLIDQERDAGLGNGGLGRLAACYLDSSSSMELPLWGYGLRYQYGIFQQLIGPDGR